MRTFTYKLAGMDSAVLGRVVRRPNSSCGNLTFVGGSTEQILSDPNLLWQHPFNIAESVLPKNCHDGEPLDLKLDDIILFLPTGRCEISYESDAFSNSFFLTERCNSRCIMCAQPPKAVPDNCDLSMSVLELIVNPPDNIGITGGEPTLAWEELLFLLRRCRKKFPTTQIQLLSNGRVMRHAECAHALAEAGGPNLSASVPIYADIGVVHDAIVGVKGAFWEAVEGIYNLQREDVAVEIRTVVLKQNYQRLPQWGQFIYRFFPFASQVAIMGLEPIALALENIDEIWIDPLDYTSYLEDAIKILHRGDLCVSLYNHQLCTIPRQLWRFARKSISEWKNVFFDECDQCIEKPHCGGFFRSAVHKKSKGISALKIGGC